MDQIEITKEAFRALYGIAVPEEVVRCRMGCGRSGLFYVEYIFVEPEVGDEIEFLNKLYDLASSPST
jgi:hypothetical protein